MTCDSCVRAFVSPKVMAVTNFLNALLIGLVGVMYFMYMPEICTKLCPSDVLCGFYCVRRILACVSHTPPPPSSHHQPHPPFPRGVPLSCAFFFRFLSRSNFAPPLPLCRALSCPPLLSLFLSLRQVVNGVIMINFSTGIIPWLDRCNRKNFGFMYTFYGRFFFIIFAGSLCFGLKDPKLVSVAGNEKVFGSHWLGILTGTLSWLSGLLNVWALCNYPEYSLDRGGMLVSPPTEGGKQMTPMGSNGGIPNETLLRRTVPNSEWLMIVQESRQMPTISGMTTRLHRRKAHQKYLRC